MTIKDLMDRTDIAAVLDVIRLHYQEDNLSRDLPRLKVLCQKLWSMAPGKALDGAVLFITPLLPGEEEDTVPEVFDEEDPSHYFDVSLRVTGEELLFSIASSSHGEYLTYPVAEETLARFSPASILAHSLWELTSHSFEDR